MSTTTDLTTLKINYLTQAQYDTAKSQGLINDDELYLTPAADSGINDVTVDGVSVVTDNVAEITMPTVPTKVSDLTNDVGYITSYTETDPTVPSWAKASSKPSYTASEVGAVPTSRTINGKALSSDITLSASDVSALPSSTVIPTVNNATLTIQKNGTTVKTFTANASSNVTANITVPTATSDLTNDSGFITGYTETDPTVPSWAKASSKPSYTASEVGAVPTSRTVNGKALSSNITLSASDVSALPSSTVIPSKTSDLTNDSGYITGYTETDPVFSASAASGITSSDISTWNGKYAKPSGGIPKTDLASAVQTSLGLADTALQSFTETDPTVPSWAKQASKPTYTASEVGALPSTTAIPSKTSDLTNDSGFITGVTSTSTPTASTISEFDSSAHMNSTDMTSQEVEDFVDNLDVSGGGGNIIEIGDYSQALTATLQSGWISNVPNDAGIHNVKVYTQGGAYFGFLTRYNTNYGAGLLSRYDGISAGAYLNNGTVTTKPLQN